MLVAETKWNMILKKTHRKMQDKSRRTRTGRTRTRRKRKEHAALVKKVFITYLN